MTSLRQRMIEDMQVRNLSPHTQRAYLQYISQFGVLVPDAQKVTIRKLCLFRLLSQGPPPAAQSGRVPASGLRFCASPPAPPAHVVPPGSGRSGSPRESLSSP